MDFNVVVDNLDSWIIPYIQSYTKESEHRINLIHDYEQISHGYITVFLSCEKIIPDNILKRSTHNIIVHESDLPKGRGWSPLTWQILEGKNEIITTIFEASKSVDEGLFYYKDSIKLNGYELINEIRDKQFEITTKLIERFINNFPYNVPYKQVGNPTYYKRRRPNDSEVSYNSRISDIFNNFRIADNIRYPIYFVHGGFKYIINIQKEKDES